MAALEVVKRRLDAVGLGDFCLELHSVKANRKSVTEELARVMSLGRRQGQAVVDGAEELLALKKRLNGYVRALHDPFGPAAMAPYTAMGRAALLANVPEVLCDLPGHEGWSREYLAALKALVEQYSRQLAVVWPVCDHPWKGAAATAAGPDATRASAAALAEMLEVLEKASHATGSAGAILGITEPQTIGRLDDALATARHIAASPGPARSLIESTAWDNIDAEARRLLQSVKRFQELREPLVGKYDLDKAAAIDWAAVSDRRRRSKPVVRWLSRSYWSDRSVIRGCTAAGYKPRFSQLSRDAESLAEAQGLLKRIEAERETGRKYFDTFWQGAESDTENLVGLGNWLHKLRKRLNAGMVGAAGVAAASADGDRRSVAALGQKLDGLLSAWRNGWASLAAAVEMDEREAFSSPADEVPLTLLASRLGRMEQGLESLQDWARYRDALEECRRGPLAAFVEQAMAAGVEPETLPVAMEKRYLQLWIGDALAAREELRRFSAANHEADRRRYAERDLEWIANTSLRLQARLAAKRIAHDPQAAPSSQLGIVHGETLRKRGGRPIRRILADAPQAVQRLKPCFMMSPLSIAQFIAPEGMRFDVVVFDEASQVEPADALGAVARGGQLVLMGDRQQLPPTSFFNSVFGGSDSTDTAEAAAITDMESILDRGSSVLPSKSLNWHYRSRHESLIAFSNQEFYDNRLIVFPSCHGSEEGLGLSTMYDGSDAYDRGRSGTNRDQAKRVARWVFDFAREHPDKSLGVGAFSQSQQQAILDEIELLRRQDDSLEEFFSRDRHEPFFVKNLETIQGDERDAVALSVGYGKADGEGRLSMNFGPLNQDGGYRRLNVLITRARERCVVFSSIEGGDFDLTATNAPGVRALKGYLEYAQSGRLPVITSGNGRFGSDFERAVYNALTEQGVSLSTQVGCAGYAIDMAVNGT